MHIRDQALPLKPPPGGTAPAIWMWSLTHRALPTTGGIVLSNSFGLGIGSSPANVTPALARHRQVLLEEEVAEVAEAMESGRLVDIAHELADVVYTAYGTALVHGVD